MGNVQCKPKDILTIYHSSEDSIQEVLVEILKEGWSANVADSNKVILKNHSELTVFKNENPDVRLHRHTTEGQFFFYRTVHESLI